MTGVMVDVSSPAHLADTVNEMTKAEPDEAPRLLSRRAVARLFGVSASTVTRWAQQGRLPTVRTPGGHYRFPEDTVRQAAERGAVRERTRLG